MWYFSNLSEGLNGTWKNGVLGGREGNSVCYKWILQLIINLQNSTNNTWRLIIYRICTDKHARHFVTVLHRVAFLCEFHTRYIVSIVHFMAENIYQGYKLLNNNYYPSLNAYTGIIIYGCCFILSFGNEAAGCIDRVGKSKCYANVGDNYRFCTTHTDEL